VHAFIIEDDYLIGQSLQDMLEPLGYTSFSFARSEDAAVMGAGEQPIDLITADVRLLPGDGLSAVRSICAKRDIPVVFITGYADELIDRAPDTVVVQKPVNEEDLRNAVERVTRPKAAAALQPRES
jgi:two-component system, response regulator PdtaR